MKGRRVPWAGTDLRHDRSEEKTVSKVSLLSKSITIKISTQGGKNPAEAVYGAGGSWYNPDSKEVGQMERKLTVIGCILWIIGLIVAIVGLNLAGDAKTWVSVIGNIVFLVGLGITGAVWLRKKKTDKETEEKR
jgi:Mg2+ and Co2+ transporter CorA